jgi:hypothetical protein
MAKSWYRNATILAAVIGGVCTLGAALTPLLLNEMAEPPLQVLSIEPIPQIVVQRAEVELTTFRAVLHNPGKKAVSLSAVQFLPMAVQHSEMPLAGKLTVASMPHARHQVISLAEPQVGQAGSANLHGMQIAPGTSAEVLLWLRFDDPRPGTRWLDMTGTLTFVAAETQATSQPFRAKAFTGRDVQRLAAPIDLNLLR